jgi:hypothetical protein
MPSDGSSSKFWNNLDRAAQPLPLNPRMLLGDASAFMPRDNLGIAASRTTNAADSRQLAVNNDISTAQRSKPFSSPCMRFQCYLAAEDEVDGVF